MNLKEEDAFHITLEEYLLALISMIEELVRLRQRSRHFGFRLGSRTNANVISQARLAVNSVTLGDYGRPTVIGNFIKELFNGFQLLNLKNDTLRKRSDAIKYSVSFHPFHLSIKFEWCGADSRVGQEGGGCGLRFIAAESDPSGPECLTWYIEQDDEFH